MMQVFWCFSCPGVASVTYIPHSVKELDELEILCSSLNGVPCGGEF
jgi:hypothetical protein